MYEHEPRVPQALRELPNVLLTPHMAGRSPEAIQATVTLLLANLDAHFAGRRVPSPVPGSASPHRHVTVGRHTLATEAAALSSGRPLVSGRRSIATSTS